MFHNLRALRVVSLAAAILTLPYVNERSGTGQAQQNVTSASLSGLINDASGAAVTGAAVTATNLETNQAHTVTSDYSGRYRFVYLPVGPYRVTVECQGFETLNKQITVTLGQALDMSFKLVVAGINEQVIVDTEVPMIETVRTQIAETIRPREIDELPLNGRNYLDFALLIPAVSRTNTGNNQRFAETSAVPGTGISVTGQRNLNNGFIIDGLSANDDAADLSGTFYSQEVVREFQTITSGGVAEFGRASAGVVNILTKSGTNNWHGRLYGFIRNQRFDARNPLAPQKDLLTQGQYGLSLGGPIRRNRTFLFTNFEQTRRNDSTVITIQPDNVRAINNRLNLVGYQGPRLETGVVPGGYDSANFFVRMDHRINAANLLTARYSLYNIAAVNSRTVGGLNAVSRGTALDNRDQTVALSNVTTLSARMLNEARFQFIRSRLRAPVNDNIGPAVNIGGVANFGTATVSPLARNIDLFEVADAVSLQAGSHALKIGGDFLLNRVDILFPGAFQGVYNFNSLSSFLVGNYSTFQQAFGAPSQFQSNPNLGLFVQDQWRWRSDLTVNAGLRYDAQFLPDPIHTDANNFAPRLGLAYAPGNRKTVIRASFGIYFDRIPLRATSNALQRDGTKYLVVQLSQGQPGAPVFPNVLALQPSSLPTKPNISVIDPNIQDSYSVQANLQVERELPGNASISVGYLHLRGLNLILSRNVNVPRFPGSAGVPNLGRPNPDFGNIARSESSGDSNYDGLVVSFNKRASNWLTLRASYTLAKAIDDAGNFFFSTPQDNFNLRADRGLSDNDQRHRLVVSGSLEAPKRRGVLGQVVNDLQLSYIFTYASRLPFNVLLGSDRNFDTNNNDRPIGVGRNTGHGFDFASLDLRLSKSFRLSERIELELLAEGFNLLNRPNFAVPNNTFGPGVTPLNSFAQPTAAFDPRQLQFGMRVSF